MKLNRRKFIAKSSLAMSMPMITIANQKDTFSELNTKLNRGDTILFQGDSITDAGREKTNQLPNNANSFGAGYAFLAASHLLNAHPDKAFNIYNRGISGNKVYQLQDRWQVDAIDLKPNLVSILIGVNDYWHKVKHGYNGTVEIYENDLRALIKRTIKELPGVRIVLCEPFILPNTSAVEQSWVIPFQKYQKAAHKIAKEFNALWVPFQSVFDKGLQKAKETYWAPDGVHPSMAGSQLMAQAWLEVVNNS
jgi:lysophospholipase L1-like esterase